MAYTFLDLADEVLKNATTPLTRREIWDQAKQSGLDKKVSAGGKTPWATLGARLSTEIHHNSHQSRFIKVKVGKEPQRYFLKSREREIPGTQKNAADPSRKKPSRKAESLEEKDLHPLLAHFVYNNPRFWGKKKIHTKTISASKTRGGRGFSEWSHPDMVGVYFPFGDMEESVVKLSKSLNSISVFKLFSFELKLTINKGNYRECFFQTVSNSSWAHEGYLVAAEISEGDELHRELGRLNNAFGIGIIHLDINNIKASEVLFHPVSRPELDWDTVDKLHNNQDFKLFIERLNIDFNANKAHRSEYDEVISEPAAYIQKILKAKSS